MSAHAELAARARAAAAGAERGSLARKAMGCVAIALDTTNSVSAGRRVIAGLEPGEIRDTALQLLAVLALESQPHGNRDDEGTANVANR
jgi:hypothetical protein